MPPQLAVFWLEVIDAGQVEAGGDQDLDLATLLERLDDDQLVLWENLRRVDITSARSAKIALPTTNSLLLQAVENCQQVFRVAGVGSLAKLLPGPPPMVLDPSLGRGPLGIVDLNGRAPDQRVVLVLGYVPAPEGMVNVAVQDDRPQLPQGSPGLLARLPSGRCFL